MNTVVTWVRKAPGVDARRLRLEIEWLRDSEGDIGVRSELRFSLPDGRQTSRTREDRWVGGHAFAALDGRFADASEIAGFVERVRSSAHEAVDEILSVVAVGSGARLIAASGESLCRPADSTIDLPPITFGSLERSERRRSGHIQWVDVASDTSLVILFDERRVGFGVTWSSRHKCGRSSKTWHFHGLEISFGVVWSKGGSRPPGCGRQRSLEIPVVRREELAPGPLTPTRLHAHRHQSRFYPR